MSRWCKTCQKEIPVGRVKAVPNATQCVGCLEESGDVPPPVGIMTYSDDFHGDPSSGTLQVTTQEDLDNAEQKFSKRRKK